VARTKKITETYPQLAARWREVLEPYRKLEEKNTRFVIESFFDMGPMAAIEEIIELRMSLTPERYRYEGWIARYGSGDEAKIASISFPQRLWNLEVAKTLLPDVLANTQAMLDGGDRVKLVDQLVKKRVELLCGFFPAFLYSLHKIGEDDIEKANRYLTGYAYRRLRRCAPNGAIMRYAKAIEQGHKSEQKHPSQALTDELPLEVAVIAGKNGLTPFGIAELHSVAAKNLEHLGRPEHWKPQTELGEGEALTLDMMEGYPDPLQEVLMTEEHASLVAAINDLPKRERHVFELYMMGYSYQEIATHQSVVQETVKDQLKKAKKKLRLTLEAA
jgi:RNA polymerase sigma factor (sigma-70 family)